MKKMKKMKAVSMALAAFLSLTMFTGCEMPELNLGNGLNTETTAGNKETNNADKETEAVSTATPEADDGSGETDVKNDNGVFPSGLSAIKNGTVDKAYVLIGDGGLYYKEADKYGIMSFDGKQDTGAIYADCDPLEQYFRVVTKIPGDENDINSLNCNGLVDVSGKVLIPEEYSSIDILNERYAQVCKVTEETDSQDEALVYYSNEMFSFLPDDDDTFYKGVWYIYDLVTGKKLDGATGTKAYNMFAYGNYVKYVSDDKVEHIVNADGRELPQNAKLFDNGYYALVQDDGGTVYDSNDNQLFNYASDGFIPYNTDDGYIAASQYINGNTRYVLMDASGKIVTPKFSSTPRVYGDLIFVEDTLYDFQGNKIVDGTYFSVYYEERLGKTWMLRTENDEYTIVTKDGTVLYKGVEDDDLYVNSVDFVVSDKVGDKTVYYSYKDKDFTIEANYSLAPFLVEVSKPDYTYDVINVISGETILQGYDDYSYANGSDSAFYIYAEKDAGGIDIYTIQ